MDVRPQIERLRSFVERCDYAGYDPYDALNSPLIRFLSFGCKYGRIAWIQLFKRFPLNLRPFLFLPTGHNPKAIGLFLWGYAKLYSVDPRSEYLDRITYLVDLLSTLRSTGYSGNCWGYNFDWQSRSLYVPKFTPTVVNSSLIGHALLDTYLRTGAREALQLAIPIKLFILEDLHRTFERDTFCFSYTPLDRTAIHNANLLAASLLIRLWRFTGDQRLRETAVASLAYSMNHQRQDGSWYYADTARQRWIDSFHTGFNLQAIRYFLQQGEAEDERHAYENGVRFYAEHFFLNDGTPKYYHDSIYPVDIHSAAQAIVFFSGEGNRYGDLTDRVLDWTLANMRDAAGWFYYRKGRFLTNRISYMRWGQAWVFHALTARYVVERY